MNDMAFGGGSEMLRDGDLEGHWALMESGMKYETLSSFTSQRVPDIRMVQDFHSYRTIALARTAHYPDPR